MSETRTTKALILAAIIGLFLSLLSTANAQPANHLESGTTPEMPSESPLAASPGSDAGAEPGPAEAASTPPLDASVADSAPAGPSAEVEGEPAAEVTAKGVYDALKGGKWLVAFGGSLMLLVWFLRAVVFGRVAWFKTKRGGAVLGIGTATILGIGTALFAGGDVSLGLIASIVAAKWTAAGAWGHVKDLLKLDA